MEFIKQNAGNYLTSYAEFKFTIHKCDDHGAVGRWVINGTKVGGHEHENMQEDFATFKECKDFLNDFEEMMKQAQEQS
tara:strand:+ start:66 stop:299 length:234 start_codon:yes stop_codon:yes gene_type:complete